MRIKACVVARIIYAREIEPLDVLYGSLIRPPDEHDLRTAPVRQLFQRLFVRKTERGGERLRFPLRIRHRIGARIDGIGRRIPRKEFSVCVVDVSAPRRNGDLPRPLIERTRIEIVLPDDLHIKKAGKKEAKNKGYRHRNGK